MFKLLGVLLLCVQLIAGSLETEELKRKCLRDEEFKDDVKICSIKNNVAIFEKIDRSMTFRCISLMVENQISDSSNLTIKVSQPYEVDYTGAVKLDPNNPDEIHLKLFQKFTARIAIISYTSGSRIDEVKINEDVLSHDWNCKAPLNMKTVCGKQKKIPTVDKQLSLSWPWVVAIYQYRSLDSAARYKASGSIISTKFILTSGNGLYFEGRLLFPEELKAHVSRKTILPHVRPEGFKIYKINKVLLHEEYKNALQNNIALMRVENYIEYNDYVSPICLPTYQRDLSEFGNVVGFAKGEWDYHPLETNTTDSPYTLVKRDVCEKNSFLMNFKHVQTFCGNGNDRLDSSGNVVNVKDLGSGLYIKKNDFYFIAGVLSKASSTDSLVVFTDVYQYLKWIK